MHHFFPCYKISTKFNQRKSCSSFEIRITSHLWQIIGGACVETYTIIAYSSRSRFSGFGMLNPDASVHSVCLEGSTGS